MTFFDDLAAMSRDLLRPAEAGGLGASAGAIVLKRTVPGTVNPAEPWEPVAPTVTQQVLRAHSFGVPTKMIDGVTVMMGDQMVISEVPTLDYKQGGGAVVTIEVDGAPWLVVSVTDIPAAGTRSAVKFLIRK